MAHDERRALHESRACGRRIGHQQPGSAVGRVVHAEDQVRIGRHLEIGHGEPGVLPERFRLADAPQLHRGADPADGDERAADRQDPAGRRHRRDGDRTDDGAVAAPEHRRGRRQRRRLQEIAVARVGDETVRCRPTREVHDGNGSAGGSVAEVELAAAGRVVDEQQPVVDGAVRANAGGRCVEDAAGRAGAAVAGPERAVGKVAEPGTGRRRLQRLETLQVPASAVPRRERGQHLPLAAVGRQPQDLRRVRVPVAVGIADRRRDQQAARERTEQTRVGRCAAGREVGDKPCTARRAAGGKQLHADVRTRRGEIHLAADTTKVARQGTLRRQRRIGVFDELQVDRRRRYGRQQRH